MARHRLGKEGGTPARVRRGRGLNAALLVTASAAGLWLGISAPDVSPVVPPTATTHTDAHTQAHSETSVRVGGR